MYWRLLRVFPMAFRDRFGDDMAEVFADRLRRARAEGRVAVARLWLRTIADLAAHGVAERRAARQHIRRMTMMQSMAQDVRFSLRLVGRQPAFAAAAILTLGLCVGANVAIFSVIRAVLIDDLPYPNPDRLVHVSLRTPRLPNGGLAPSVPAFQHLRSHDAALSVLGMAVSGSETLTGAGDAEWVRTRKITLGFDRIVALPPLAGRLFVPEDFAPDADAVLLSETTWRNRFKSEEAIVGRQIRLSGRRKTIVGIVPDDFDIGRRGEDVTEIWQPLIWNQGAGSTSSFTIARLAEGETLESARARLDVHLAGFAGSTEGAISGVALESFTARETASLRPGLFLLQAASILLLVIGCVNVANLFLAQGHARGRELAVRAALGAGRRRVIRQLFTESAAIAAIGGLLGVAVAYLAVPALVSTASWTLPRPDLVEVRGVELAVGLGLALLTAVGFGLLPGVLSTRIDVIGSLRMTSSQSTVGRPARRLRGTLVAVEVLLAVVCLAAAGLIIRSFARVAWLPMGFDAERVVVAEIPLGAAYLADDRQRAFARQLEGELGSRFGPAAVALASSMPYTSRRLGPPWSSGAANATARAVAYLIVNEHYFDVLRIPLIRGRVFQSKDGPGSEPVVIVNEQFVRELTGERDIVGHLVGWGRRQARVVGVVGDTRTGDPAQPPDAAMYWPLEQQPSGALKVAVRTSDAAAGIVAVRETLRRLDPELPLVRAEPIALRIDRALARRQFYFLLLSLFASLGVALAAIGIYGVVSSAARERVREVGVRAALGATRGQLQLLMVRQGFVPIAAGLVGGLLAAWWVTSLLGRNATFAAQLYGVTPHDAVTLVAATATVVIAAGLACWIPARRAASAEAADILRAE